ncbi:FAD-binding protein [Nocardia sp. NBC_01499]
MAVGTEVPRVVSSPARWDDTADVLVVGFGIAGACAAISAGADVLVLERTRAAGGASAAGHFYLGDGTPVQQATGHADSAAAMCDYLTAVTPEPDHAEITAYYVGFTLSGLSTTVDGEVLRADGAVIEGLYAAGVLRVHYRAGHRRLFEWNLPRGGLVLRAPRRGTRGAAAPGRRLICASPMPRR